MAKRKKNKTPHSVAQIKGFARVQLVEHDKNGKRVVVGDSGWRGPNQVVDLGFRDYLVNSLGQGGGSLQVSRMVLGTGGAPAAAATALPGELNTATYTRTTVTFAQVASKTARFTATFASANSHITASVPLSNIGIINDTTSAGTIMAGTTYTSSQWNTNQDVNATYEIRFA